MVDCSYDYNRSLCLCLCLSLIVSIKGRSEGTGGSEVVDPDQRLSHEPNKPVKQISSDWQQWGMLDDNPLTKEIIRWSNIAVERWKRRWLMLDGGDKSEGKLMKKVRCVIEWARTMHYLIYTNPSLYSGMIYSCCRFKRLDMVNDFGSC